MTQPVNVICCGWRLQLRQWILVTVHGQVCIWHDGHWSKHWCGGGRNAASLYETYKKAKVFCPDTHKLVRFQNAHWLQKSLQSLPDLMTLG